RRSARERAAGPSRRTQLRSSDRTSQRHWDRRPDPPFSLATSVIEVCETRCQMRFVGALAITVSVLAADARADEEDAPKPHVDQGRAGRPLVYAAPPEIPAPMRVCSLHLPLCVHADRASPPATMLAVLSAAERAWATLT